MQYKCCIAKSKRRPERVQGRPICYSTSMSRRPVFTEGADPVVYLAGGAGDIAPLEVNGLIAADFIRDRDIYVVSQRGSMSRRLPARPPTTSPESFLASASTPTRRSARIWPRPRLATANSRPPAPTSAPTIQLRAPPISPISARCLLWHAPVDTRPSSRTFNLLRQFIFSG